MGSLGSTTTTGTLGKTRLSKTVEFRKFQGGRGQGPFETFFLKIDPGFPYDVSDKQACPGTVLSTITAGLSLEW